MPPSDPLSVPLKLQPGGKILLLSLLVTVLGQFAAAGGSFESRTSVSNLPLLLPLMVNHLPATEARVSPKERGGTAAGGEKVGPLILLGWFVAGTNVH